MRVVQVAVAGASGYAGGELLRLLLRHPSLSLGTVAAGASAGSPITALHQQLPELEGLAFADTSPDLLSQADLVFLALPNGQSSELVQQLPPDLPIVDLAGDFRLERAADWERFYGGPYAGAWTYGMPELPGARERIQASRRIANPGCYVTAITLALAPLLAENQVAGADITVVAASGTSGAGRGLKPNLLATEVMGSMSAYKVGGTHQHTPEIEQNLRSVTDQPVSISFTPMLAPMSRGILATCSAKVPSGTTTEQVRDCLSRAYADEPFVRVLPPDRWPTTAATYGANTVLLQVAVDAHVGRAVVVAAEDNLVKGAAGQALQNANLVLGLPETAGLSAMGVAP